MSQTNVQAAQRLYDAFNSGNLEAFEQGVASHLIWNQAENGLNSSGNPYRTFAQVRDGVFAPTMRDFDNFQVALERLIDAGDFVIGTGRYRGKSTATGKDLSAQFCHILHIDGDGKLDWLQQYTDTLQEAEVTGRAQQLDPMEMLQPAL